MPTPLPDTTTAIHRLKAELLSPDWTLSPKRNSALTKAMISLSFFFNSRRYVKGLVMMARHLLSHLEHSSDKSTTPIELLKEIMAHTVTFYEQEKEDIDAEKKLCNHYLTRFKRLNIKVQTKTRTTSPFSAATHSLRQRVTTLHDLAPQFSTLSTTKQIEAMLTVQSLIAETEELQKLIPKQR